MKPSIIIEKILGLLQHQAEATVDIIDAMMSPRGESYRKLKRGIKYGPRHFKTDWAETYRDNQKFYSLMNYLKNQGLVENKKQGAKSTWKITAKGVEKLKIIKHRNLYSQTSANYGDAGSDTTQKIIAYDIPAAEGNRKRFWLRWALLNMGFKMLQKSVWVGKKKIPEEFMNDLRERKMLKYIQIFEVTKSGTLHEIA
jgi:hypothetical protein